MFREVSNSSARTCRCILLSQCTIPVRFTAISEKFFAREDVRSFGFSKFWAEIRKAGQIIQVRYETISFLMLRP